MAVDPNNQPYIFVWALGAIGAALWAWDEAQSLGFFEAEGLLDAAAQARWMGMASLIVAGACAFMFGQRWGLSKGYAAGWAEAQRNKDG